MVDSSNIISLSRGRSLFRELSTVANNIANSSTNGYKANKILFSEYVSSLPETEASISIAHAGAYFLDLSQGALTRTGNNLDFAIEGEGFFQVETPNGIRLTRNGTFTLDPQGRLVTSEGYGVLGEGGGVIEIPQNGGEISLSTDGTLSVGGEPAGRVELVTAPADSLNHEGASLLRFDETATEIVENPIVVQGFLEGSNVNPVSEISRLIEIQRSYETIQNLEDQGERRFRTLVNAIERN